MMLSGVRNRRGAQKKVHVSTDRKKRKAVDVGHHRFTDKLFQSLQPLNFRNPGKSHMSEADLFQGLRLV